MELVIYQGSYAFSSPFRKIRIKPTQIAVQRTNITSLCVDPAFNHGSIRKSLKTSYFKSNEDILSGLQKVQNGHVHSTSDVKESLPIHNLFKSWLTFLPLASQYKDESLASPPSNERVETDHEIIKSGILKSIWSAFSGMDLTIKIPMIIFIPLFLIVRLKYGTQVVNELTPLWLGGPLLVVLYILALRVITSLYIFSFKKSVKVVNNFSREKVKEFFRVYFWQHVVYFKNLDYKHELKRLWEEFGVWVGDKCLDLVELVWSYRKMIKLLKIVNIYSRLY